MTENTKKMTYVDALDTIIQALVTIDLNDLSEKIFPAI